MGKIHYWIDYVRIGIKTMYVAGWCCTAEGHRIDDISIVDEKDNAIESDLTRSFRSDAVKEICGKNDSEQAGFYITFPMEKEHKYYLVLEYKGKKRKIHLTGMRILKYRIKKRIQMIKGVGSNDTIRRSFAEDSTITYREFNLMTRVNELKLKKERDEILSDDAPTFSILVPLYNTPVSFLKEMIDSVEKQSYSKWELCLADGSDSEHTTVIKEVVDSFQDKRIRYRTLEKNEGISENTNEALKMASGDFILLFDHDDLLTPNALYEFYSVVKKDLECDCIYSDEDKINSETGELFEPHFKPNYNIDMLCTDNYICHLFGVRKTLVDRYGGFRKEYDGAQDHDFILRMTEQARHIVHIPKVLYHWRVHPNSTSSNPESKMYAFTAGQKAVKAHYERVWPQIKIERVENGASLGIYHTIWHFDEYHLISIIIPNMDHSGDLDKAIRSMITKGTWPNLEFIVVENNSKNEETFKYYEKIQKEFSNVHVIKYEGEFNYSRLNNFGVKYAHGDYYLFMNNDIELIEADSIKEMMGYGQREDVGIVGARLLYPDNTLQHAGVIIGMRGVASHAFKNQKSDSTYFNRALVAQDYSAVTAAVMLVRKSVYESVNGFDESFQVALNDIDFCLRVRDKGKLVVYNPYACFYHYESKSRGQEDTEEKFIRFQGEIARFVDRYHDFIQNGDPFYNPNLTLLKEDFELRNVKFEKIGEPFYSRNEMSGLKKMEEMNK